MLTHVVMFKLIDRTTENAHELRRRLMTLPPLIPQIKYMEMGVNVLSSDRAYDVVLFQRFDSLTDMHAYQTHPAHLEVLTYIRAIVAGTASVDYETNAEN